MTTLLLAVGYLLFAILSWRRLSWAVLFVIATLPSYLIRFKIGPIPMTFSEGMLIIIFVAAVFHRIRKVSATLSATHNYKNILSKTFNYPLRSALILPLGLFIAAATISLFVAPDLRSASGIWKSYFIEPILFFVILLDLTIHHPKLLNKTQIIAALSISALLLSLYAIYQRFTGFGIPPPWDAELRVTSIFPYPNALGLFLAPLVPLFVAQMISYPRKGKILLTTYYLLLTTVTLLAIIFAKSTGALVGIGAGMFIMLLLHLSSRGASQASDVAISRHGMRLLRPAAAGLAMTVVVILLGIIFSTKFPSIRQELLLQDWSGHVRRSQWAETVKMLKDRPILGAGLAGYKETLGPYHKATYLEIFEYPHNIVLNFWSEIGLLGLLAFAWLIIIFFRAGVGYESAAIASMVVILVHGLVDVPYFKNDLAILFWIIYALGLSSAKTPEHIPS